MFAFCEVNLTLEKKIKLFGQSEVSLALDVLNAFNNKNFGGYDGFLANRKYAITTDFEALDSPNRELLQPTNLSTLPRRFQLRAGFRF